MRITRGVIRPLNLVMLTRDRIQEVLDEAVSRGRVTTDDAQDLARNLFERGRKQTNDVLGDLEQLLGRGGDQLQDARKAAGRARAQVGSAWDFRSRVNWWKRTRAKSSCEIETVAARVFPFVFRSASRCGCLRKRPREAGRVGHR